MGLRPRARALHARGAPLKRGYRPYSRFKPDDGKVSEVFPGEDGIVRKVHVTYKNPKQGEPAYIYNGREYITVERSVN